MLVAVLLLAAAATAPDDARLIGADDLPVAARAALAGREAAALERFLDGYNAADAWAAPRPAGPVTFSNGEAAPRPRDAKPAASPADRALAGLARAERLGFPRATTVAALRKLADGEGPLALDARALLKDLGMAAFE